MLTKNQARPSGTKVSQESASPAPIMPIKVVINWLNTKDDGNIRATASMNIGGAFAVHGIKIISGNKGEFVSMPSYKSGDKYKDIFDAVTAEAREQMNDAVMKAFKQKLAEEQTESFGEDISEDNGIQGMNQ